MSMRAIPKPLPPMNTNQGELLYLMLDGSQISDLEKKIYQFEGNPNYLPIYLHEPWQQLKEVTPCIVETTGPLIEWFIKNASVNQGYFFSSREKIDNIAETFRALIQVQTPYGSKVFFKMAHAEAAKILFEDNHPMIWHHIEQVWLPTRSGWFHKSNPESSVLSDNPALILNDDQWKRLGQISWQNTLEKIERHLNKWFSEQLPTVHEDWLQKEAKNAYDKGFSSERDLLLYFNIFGFLGKNALKDDGHPDILALINQPSLETPSQRIQKASSLAEQYAMQQQTQEQEQ